MRLRILSLLLVLAVPAALDAQIPPRRQVAAATGPGRIVVGTPMVEEGAELTQAVELGIALRDRLSRAAGAKYTVVSRDALNRVLASSGYEADAPLGEAAVRALGTQLQAALVLAAGMRREADGQLSVWASLAAPKDQAPRRVSRVQAPGESLAALGGALADELATELR